MEIICKLAVLNQDQLKIIPKKMTLNLKKIEEKTILNLNKTHQNNKNKE
jgi:hypothetical protein